jgi:predicted Rossmann fold nucleotide-binding protein DprA/Smf involved in DNA uptake
MGIDGSFHTLGNTDLLGLHKVAFLCSRNCPAALLRKARDWAVEQRQSGACVISGFHSRIEKEVLQQLLLGSQPVILALASGMKSFPTPELQAPLDAGRLLAITRYAASVSHPCEEKCYQRNRLMLQLADEVTVGYASPGGNLERLCSEYAGMVPLRYLLDSGNGEARER